VSAPRRGLVAILLTISVYGIGMGLTLPLLSLTLEGMGVSGTINGLNLATGGLAALLLTPLMPAGMARVGAAQFMAAALACAASALLCLHFVASLWAWFPIRFVLSASLNGLFVATEFWINAIADEHNRGRYVALYSVCLTGSYALGPVLLQLIGTSGLAPFAAGSALMISAIVPIALARKHAPRTTAPAGHRAVFGILKEAPVAFAAAAVFGAIDVGMAGLLPVYAVRQGYSDAHAALAVSALSLGALLLQFPLGWLADRMARERLLALCAGCGIIGAALTPLAVSNPITFYLVLILWGGIVLGIYTVALTLLGERFSGPAMATANAAFVMSYCLGLLGGPALEGAALQAWNPQGLIIVLGGICAGYFGFLILRRPLAA
jgi:MFS family permease